MELLSKLFKNGRQNGKRLWSDSSEFDRAWTNRIRRMASYIDTPGAVADFGCGMMWLEECLSPRNTYFPIDYLQRDERTLVIDFNKDPLPKIDAAVAFMSGSLEYVADVPTFMRNLMKLPFQQMIMSYCTLEKNPSLRFRKTLNWQSNESIFSLLAVCCEQYDLTQIDNTVEGNTILVFRRKSR